jgi:hypothetical protein
MRPGFPCRGGIKFIGNIKTVRHKGSPSSSGGAFEVQIKLEESGKVRGQRLKRRAYMIYKEPVKSSKISEISPGAEIFEVRDPEVAALLRSDHKRLKNG